MSRIRISIFHKLAYCAALACRNRTSSSAACALPIAVSRPSTWIWLFCMFFKLRFNCSSTGPRSESGESRDERSTELRGFRPISSGRSPSIATSLSVWSKGWSYCKSAIISSKQQETATYTSMLPLMFPLSPPRLCVLLHRLQVFFVLAKQVLGGLDLLIEQLLRVSRSSDFSRDLSIALRQLIDVKMYVFGLWRNPRLSQLAC